MKKTNKEITMELCKGSDGNLERLLSYLIDDEIDLTKITTSSKENQMQVCIKTEELLYSLGMEYSEDILKALNFSLNNLINNKAKFYSGAKFSTRVDHVFNTTFNSLKSTNNNVFTQALHFVNKNKDLYQGLEPQHISKLILMALIRIVVKDCGVIPYTKSVPDNVKFYRTTRPNKPKETTEIRDSEPVINLPETSSVDLSKEVIDVESMKKGLLIPDDQIDSVLNYLTILGYKIEKEEVKEMKAENVKPVIEETKVEETGDKVEGESVIINNLVKCVMIKIDEILMNMRFTLSNSERTIIINELTDIIKLLNKLDDTSTVSEYINIILPQLDKILSNDEFNILFKKILIKAINIDSKIVGKLLGDNGVKLIISTLNDNKEVLVKLFSNTDDIELLNKFFTDNIGELISLSKARKYNEVRNLFVKFSLSKISLVQSLLPLLSVIKPIIELFSDDDETDTDVIGNKMPKLEKPNLTPVVNSTNTSTKPVTTTALTITKHKVEKPQEKLLGFAALNNMIKTKGFSFI